jgi:hypothetical protein
MGGADSAGSAAKHERPIRTACSTANFQGRFCLREIVPGRGSHAPGSTTFGPPAGCPAPTFSMQTPSAQARFLPNCWLKMVKRTCRGLRGALGESVQLIDSNSLRLTNASAEVLGEANVENPRFPRDWRKRAPIQIAAALIALRRRLAQTTPVLHGPEI